MEFTKLKYPNMRQELITTLSALSDGEYQKNCWVLNKCPEGVERDNLDLAIHFLFDDTSLSSDPNSWIGIVLRDDIEATAVKCVCDALDKVLEEHGCGCSDDYYINSAEWPDVLRSASAALSVLENNSGHP